MDGHLSGTGASVGVGLGGALPAQPQLYRTGALDTLATTHHLPCRSHGPAGLPTSWHQHQQPALGPLTSATGVGSARPPAAGPHPPPATAWPSQQHHGGGGGAAQPISRQPDALRFIEDEVAMLKHKLAETRWAGAGLSLSDMGVGPPLALPHIRTCGL